MKTAVALVSLLFGIVCFAAARGNTPSDIPCAPSESRLYVPAGDGGGKTFVNVYCGRDTKPSAVVSDGIKGYLGEISSDNAGRIYVVEWNRQGINTDSAVLIYDSHGRFLARVGGLENDAGVFVDQNDGTVYANTPHYEDYRPSQWINESGWIPHLTVIAANPPSVKHQLDPPSTVDARFYLIDDPGYIYFWDNINGHIDKMDARTGKIVKSVFTPAGAMVLAPNHNIIANGYGTIRIVDLKTFKIVRTFHDGSSTPQDDGPIAVGRDGTLFVVHKKSETIEVFSPGASKASAVIRDVGVVSTIAVDNDGTVIAAVGGSERADIRGGIYAFKVGKSGPERVYCDSAGRPLGALESFALALGH
jgi:WD40 repeat protein